jgi:hypothetical protein
MIYSSDRRGVGRPFGLSTPSIGLCRRPTGATGWFEVYREPFPLPYPRWRILIHRHNILWLPLVVERLTRFPIPRCAAHLCRNPANAPPRTQLLRVWVNRGRSPLRLRPKMCRRVGWGGAHSASRPGTPPRFGVPRPAREPGWHRPETRGQPCPAARPARSVDAAA